MFCPLRVDFWGSRCHHHFKGPHSAEPGWWLGVSGGFGRYLGDADDGDGDPVLGINLHEGFSGVLWILGFLGSRWIFGVSEEVLCISRVFGVPVDFWGIPRGVLRGPQGRDWVIQGEPKAVSGYLPVTEMGIPCQGIGRFCGNFDVLGGFGGVPGMGGWEFPEVFWGSREGLGVLEGFGDTWEGLRVLGGFRGTWVMPVTELGPRAGYEPSHSARAASACSERSWGGRGSPQTPGDPKCSGTPELPSSLDLLQAEGHQHSAPTPHHPRGAVEEIWRCTDKLGGPSKGTPRNPHWGVRGDPEGVLTQLQGQRKEGLDHGICTSPTPWGSRGHSRRDKTRQGQRLERARPGSRSSCSIALLEKALGWFRLLKGVEGREEAIPNTAPVSQPPLSVSQKELDGLCSSLRQLSTRS
ncbi:hypothetical protein DV515_00017400 [Chloebia gouldiae]|uniref:Uncharacterized protein n=1 Tax=Chloebia gouldiae TaxID=44316 RepID=A0A3L8QWA2_CHLGU|nr:hypothetical protein DV515_00017400 [Chloebia gouldiae]